MNVIFNDLAKKKGKSLKFRENRSLKIFAFAMKKRFKTKGRKFSRNSRKFSFTFSFPERYFAA